MPLSVRGADTNPPLERPRRWGSPCHHADVGDLVRSVAGTCLLVCATLAASGCSGDGSHSEEGAEPLPTSTVQPHDAGAFYMGVEVAGTLDPVGDCLVLSTKAGQFVPVWPRGYTVRRAGGKEDVLDERGNAVASASDRVVVSG